MLIKQHDLIKDSKRAQKAQIDNGLVILGVAIMTTIHAETSAILKSNHKASLQNHSNKDMIIGVPNLEPIETRLRSSNHINIGNYLGMAFELVTSAFGCAVGVVINGFTNHKSDDEYLNKLDRAELYWRENFSASSNDSNNFDFDRDYLIAYRLGYLSQIQSSKGVSFDQDEARLKLIWDEVKNKSRLSWQQAKPIVQEAWKKADN